MPRAAFPSNFLTFSNREWNANVADLLSSASITMESKRRSPKGCVARSYDQMYLSMGFFLPVLSIECDRMFFYSEEFHFFFCHSAFIISSRPLYDYIFDFMHVIYQLVSLRSTMYVGCSTSLTVFLNG